MYSAKRSERWKFRRDSSLSRGSTPTGTPLSGGSRIGSGFGSPAHQAGDQPQHPKSPDLSSLVKSEGLQQAIQEYVDKLSNDDQIAFRSATDIMDKLGEQQWGKFRITNFHITRMQKVLQCVDQFLGSIAICIQYDLRISSLVVGGLNCILAVSTLYLPY